MKKTVNEKKLVESRSRRLSISLPESEEEEKKARASFSKQLKSPDMKNQRL